MYCPHSKSRNILVVNQTEKMPSGFTQIIVWNFVKVISNCFVKNGGIARHHTVINKTLQNGIVERINRPIMAELRCMLSNSSLQRVLGENPLQWLVIWWINLHIGHSTFKNFLVVLHIQMLIELNWNW